MRSTVRAARVTAAASVIVFAACAACRRRGASAGEANVPSERTGAPDAAAAESAPRTPAPDGGSGSGETEAKPRSPPERGCAPEAAVRIPTSPDPLPGGVSIEEVLGAAAAAGAEPIARIETTVATLDCTLDAAGAPRTVANFAALATGVRPWWDPCRGEWVREPMYDGMAFHKLEPGFVAQAGCPIGDGTAGPGFAIPDEPRAEARHDAAGILSMASLGPGTAGSQFFVTLAPALELDRGFTPFGRCGPDESLAALDAAARDGIEVRIRKVRMERGDP